MNNRGQIIQLPPPNEERNHSTQANIALDEEKRWIHNAAPFSKPWSYFKKNNGIFRYPYPDVVSKLQSILQTWPQLFKGRITLSDGLKYTSR